MAVVVDPYTFSNGTVADALEVNARFDELYGLQDGNIDAANVDLTDDYTWTGTHVFTGAEITGAGAGNAILQYANSATDRTLTIPDPGANADFVVTAAAQTIGGIKTFSDHIYLTALKRLYLDGGGNTYIHEPVADQYEVVVGGSAAWNIGAGSADLSAGFDFSIEATQKLFLDGNNDTYITESSANTLDTYVGGNKVQTLLNRFNIHTYTSADANSPTYRFFHQRTGGASLQDNDGVGEIQFRGMNSTPVDTEFAKMVAAANDVTNGTEDAQLTLQLMEDGSLGTRYTFRSNGLLLPADDPPTANYSNRNGNVKGWVQYEDGGGGTPTGSYNVEDITDDDGDGIFIVNWDTNFADTTYCAVGSAIITPQQDIWLSISSISGAGDTTVVLYDNSIPGPVDDDFCVMAIGTQ
jgi:hypothetical protein